MDVCDAYDQWSATYHQDLNRTWDLDRTAVRTLLDGAWYGSALEIGCGTGKNTPIFAGIAEHVLGLDLSPACSGQATIRGREPHVHLARADLVRSWPVRAGSVDLVACSLVLEHLEHLEGIFAEAARVLAPGGHFLVSELHPYRQYRGTTARYERDGLEVTIPAHVHHVSDFLRAAQDHGMRLRRPGTRGMVASPGRGKAAAADHGPVRGLT